MGVIRFNGISSADFGCTIERRPNHTRGSRRGELIEIPGRNGAIVLGDGSYSTYVQQYVVAFEEGNTMPPYKRAEQVAAWLLGSHGFCRLEDDFEPDVYRMARYAGPLNIEQVASEYGRCVIEFECQPQRYLKSGEMQIQFYVNRLRFALLSKGMKTYGIPDWVASVKVIAEKETTVTKLINPDTGVETVGTPHLDDDEWAGRYVTEIERSDGDTQLNVYLGRKSNPLLIDDGTVILMFVSDGGEETKIAEFTDDGFVLVNPTDNVAKPLLRFWKNNDQTAESEELYAFSNVEINGTTIALDFSDEDEIILDCDLHDARYLLGGNANSKVTFTSETDAYPTFPTFGAGLQSIKPTDGYYLSFLISPRWWAL